MKISKEKIMKTINNVEDFLFKPYSCMFCGDECDDEEFRMCSYCKDKLNFTKDKYCKKCGAKLSGDYDYCIECKSLVHEFDKARSVFVYDENSAPAILKFKYGGKKTFALPLAKFLLKRFSECDIICDILTFVPMPEDREKQRGYNQSFELCREFSALSGIPFFQTLERVKHVERQATLGKQERRKNMEGSFGILDKKTVKGKHVLLIDDVVTTGATADECSKTLLKAGAKSVSVLSLAKTASMGN